MEVKELKIDQIKPYDHNPRNNDGAVAAVAASIKEFGFKVPIVIDREGVIVAGHTRYKAAKQLGLESVPCITADDLSEEQVRAFRLADNKVGELAGWDFDLLNMELAGIEELDMSQFGFDPAEMLQELEEVHEDEIPEEVEGRTVLGDLWELGGAPTYMWRLDGRLHNRQTDGRREGRPRFHGSAVRHEERSRRRPE